MHGLLRMILPQGRFIYKTIIVFFFLAVTYLFIKENGKNALNKLLGLRNKPWLVLFLLCTAYLLTCTVIGRYLKNPYKSIWGSFGVWKQSGNLNEDMFANIIMFIPYIFLFLKACNPLRPFRSAMLLTVSTTLFVELSQLIGWLGNFQIADLLYNTIGGLIGFGIWYIEERFLG